MTQYDKMIKKEKPSVSRSAEPTVEHRTESVDIKFNHIELTPDGSSNTVKFDEDHQATINTLKGWDMVYPNTVSGMSRTYSAATLWPLVRQIGYDKETSLQIAVDEVLCRYDMGLHSDIVQKATTDSESSEFKMVKTLLNDIISYRQVNNLNNTKQESKIMNNELRTITLTLIDNNDNLEDTQRVVFKRTGYLTSFTNQQAKEDIIATGDVKKALEVHNKEVRAIITREDILESTGRDVKLKPIKLLSDPQLSWRIVETA